jgi:hypothetical protein
MLTSKQGIILEAARPVVGQTELPHYINLSVLYNKQRGAFSAIDTSWATDSPMTVIRKLSSRKTGQVGGTVAKFYLS